MTDIMEPKKAHQYTPQTAKAAVQKRWDAANAEENETRERYRSVLSVEEAMAELARIRRTAEIAASEVNQRMNAGGEKCAICGREFDGRTRPAQIEAVRDPATGVLYNNYYCSIICIQQRNKAKLGMEAMIDRGMVAGKSA